MSLQPQPISPVPLQTAQIGVRVEKLIFGVAGYYYCQINLVKPFDSRLSRLQA
jgi:hypothetical protein